MTNTKKTHNTIYLAEVIEKPGMVKVGDTERAVKTRIKEWALTGGLHLIREPIEIEATDYKNEIFRDKELHKRLTKKGFKRQDNYKGHPSEWFECTTDDVIEIISELKKKPVSKKLTLRIKQKFLIDKIQEKWNNTNLINVEAATRIGKTISLLQFAYNNNLTPVWVGKELTATSSGEKDHLDFFKDKPFSTVSLHKDFKEFDKLKNFKDILLIVDESDSQSHTNNSIEKIKIIYQNYDVKGIITMSATRSHRGLKILNRIKKDLNLTKEPEELRIPYYMTQEVDSDTTLKRDIAIYNISAKETLVDISTALTNDKLTQEVVDFFIKYGLSEDDYKLQEKAPHIYVYLGVGSKSKLTRFCKILRRKVKDHKVLEIFGETTSNKKAEIYVEESISKSKKPIIMVTNGMAATSFSIKGIGRTIVFGDTIDARRYQAMHRSTTYLDSFSEKKAQMFFISSLDGDYTNTYIDPLAYECNLKSTPKSKENTIQVYKRFIKNQNSIVYRFIGSDDEDPRDVSRIDIGKLLDKHLESTATLNNMVETVRDADIEFNSNGLDIEVTKKQETEKGKDVDAFGDEIKKPKGTKKTRDKDKKLDYKKVAISLWYLAALVAEFGYTSSLSTICNLDSEDYEKAMLDENIKELFNRNISLNENEKRRKKIIFEFFNILLNESRKTNKNISPKPIYDLFDNIKSSKKKPKKVLAVFGTVFSAHLFEDKKIDKYNKYTFVYEDKTEVFYKKWIKEYNNIKLVSMTEFLEGDYNLNFDHIVGNPPYQYGNDTETSKKLYIDITAKLLRNGAKNISFITPIAIFQNGSKNSCFDLLKNKITYINYDTDNFFDIGTKVCSWKYENKECNSIEVINNGKRKIVNSFKEAISIRNSVLQNIISKLDYKENGRPHLYINDSSNEKGLSKNKLSDIKTEDFCIPVLSKTGKKYKYTTKEFAEKQTKRNKIIIPLQGGWSKGMIIGTDYVSNGWMVNNSKSKYSTTELLNMKYFLESKLITYAVINYNIEIKPSGVYSFLFRLPEISLTKKWTDEELYDEFNITSEEQKIIENWYKDWKN